MKSTNQRLAFALAVGLLVAGGFASTASAGSSGGDALQVSGSQVVGNTVLVTVSNVAPVPVSGEVTVTVRVLGLFTLTSTENVSVDANSSGSAEVSFVLPVSSVQQIGITEEMNPI